MLGHWLRYFQETDKIIKFSKTQLPKTFGEETDLRFSGTIDVQEWQERSSKTREVRAATDCSTWLKIELPQTAVHD